MTVEEQRAAYLVGVRRSRSSRQRGASHLVGWRMEIPEEHADGFSAVAEALVAERVGGRWISAEEDAPDDLNAGDVEGGYSVRWTPRENGRLIVRAKDPDHLTMVLVVGVPPDQRIVGSIETCEAKSDLYLDGDPPAWFVPQTALRPL